jgi:benzoate membrane transport protein
VRSRLSDLNAAAMSAGIATFAIYVFMGLPVQLAVFRQLGLTAAESSSWLLVTWVTTGVASLVVAFYLRQPQSITLTIPGMIYLGTLGTHYSFDQLAFANLVAGVVIFALGLAGVGQRVLRWFPLPIVMGMFAGTILSFATRLVGATVDDFAVAGPAVLAYLAGRAIGHPRVPPVGLAVAAGSLALALGGRGAWPHVPLEAPSVLVPHFEVVGSALLTVTVPMVLLTIVVGNVQGFAFLQAEGYSVRANFVTAVGGVASIVNALFGGHPAGLGRTGIAVMASPEAGPPEGRYWAALIPSVLAIVVALAAAPVIALVEALPATFVATIAGLAVIGALQSALMQAFAGPLQFGAVVAFAVAITPFSIAGITSPFWAIVAGIVASLAAERGELFAAWSVGNAPVGEGPARRPRPKVG